MEARARDGGREARHSRVVIVGAGASGLSAAQSLLAGLPPDDGVPPLVILEARHRVGGRIHTSSLTLEGESFSVDLGAAWVHGTGVGAGRDGDGEEEALNPMVKLLRQRRDLSDACMNEDPLKAGLVYTSPRGNPDTRPRDAAHLLEVHVAGRRIERQSPDTSKALDLYEAILSSASKIGHAAYDCGEGMSTTAISIGRTIDMIRSHAPERYALGYQFQDKTGKGTDVESLLRYYFHALQDWHPHDLSNVQLSEFIVDVEGEGERENNLGGGEGDYPGPHCNVRGGMATLLGPLQDNGVKQCIRCDCEVVRIERRLVGGSDGVFIACRNGTEFSADFCIVTIPIGCLKSAVKRDLFHPSLSEEKQEAILMLQTGCYRKIFLLFDDIFWPTEPSFFGLVRSPVRSPELLGATSSDGLGNYLSVGNSHARNGIACLEATLGGGGARWARGKGDDELRAEVLRFLDESMQLREGASFVSRCVGCHVTRWEEDEFSMGSYAGFQLGTLERHAEDLGRPEWNGRLVFAGDAIISEYEGSVHGALLSGEEAANKVLELIYSCKKIG